MPQSISPRIVGGRDATIGQAPYQCSLQRKSSGHYCGCAIISNRWILSAGHCLNKYSIPSIRPMILLNATKVFGFLFNFRRSPTDIKILVGTNDRRNKGGKYYNAKKFIIHKDYGNPTYAHDIGLIHVQTPIEFNERVQPIKISSNEVKAGLIMQVFGWGRLGVSLFYSDKSFRFFSSMDSSISFDYNSENWRVICIKFTEKWTNAEQFAIIKCNVNYE